MECCQQMGKFCRELTIEKSNNWHCHLLCAHRKGPRNRAAQQSHDVAPLQLIGLHLLPQPGNSAGIIPDCRRSSQGLLRIAGFRRGLCPIWVKTGKSRSEHMFSGSPPKADSPIRA
jgi:hypothetical protein